MKGVGEVVEEYRDVWLGRHSEYEDACRAVELAEIEYLGYSRTPYHNYEEVFCDTNI